MGSKLFKGLPEKDMTIQYDFDELNDRRCSDSIKWRKYAEDILPMWVADMDFLSPEPVIRTLRERIEHGFFGYPDCISDDPNQPSILKQVIIERLIKLYDWQVQPEQIIFVPGVVTGFNLACHALVSPETAVVIQTPVYPPILGVAKETGVQGQEMELTLNPDGSYDVDWDAFERSLTSQSKLFMLCNPHNPVGKVFRKDELLRTAEICLRHGMMICSDEIHCDLVYSGHKHIPLASLDPEISRNTITLMAPSKTYNLAGLQCSFAIIQNAELRKRYLHARGGLVPWVNLMGMVAAQSAYQQGDDWVAQLLQYLEANRDFLCDYISRELPAVKVGKPEGTYLAWLDCRQTNIIQNPSHFFLEQGRVAFNDGETFGKGGQGFVRLNFGCPRSTLINGLERINKALQNAR
jgi:cystathionine beta-lyase